jgi:hypothetical protein
LRWGSWGTLYSEEEIGCIYYSSNIIDPTPVVLYWFYSCDYSIRHSISSYNLSSSFDRYLPSILLFQTLTIRIQYRESNLPLQIRILLADGVTIAWYIVCWRLKFGLSDSIF